MNPLSQADSLHRPDRSTPSRARTVAANIEQSADHPRSVSYWRVISQHGTILSLQFHGSILHYPKMAASSAVTNWSIFAVVVGAACWYYVPRGRSGRTQSQDQRRNSVSRKGKGQGQEPRGRANRRLAADEGQVSGADSETKTKGGRGVAREKKVQQESSTVQEAPRVVVQDDGQEDADREWAARLAQTQRGTILGGPAKKEKRIRTVKQSSALSTPALSSREGSEADDDMSPTASPLTASRDVSDMLEPAPAGPSVLRVTGSTQPEKEATPKKPKEAVVETKKQRQNRKKAEDRKLEREAEEAERQKLAETQRRTAREARGEPAKNGIPASAPASNAWQQKKAPVKASLANGSNAPLLDTFDAESTASSNGPLDASTRPTSTSDGEMPHHYNNDAMRSEEEQLAQAKRASEDESGWHTVAVPKKGKKKQEDAVLGNKTNAPAPVPAVAVGGDGKPKGFQALDVQYERRTDIDPNDASAWEA